LFLLSGFKKAATIFRDCRLLNVLLQKCLVLFSEKIFKVHGDLINVLLRGAGRFESHLVSNLLVTLPIHCSSMRWPLFINLSLKRQHEKRS